MSFKTITVILLVSCLGATGTSFGVSEEPPQDGRVAAPVLTITDVRWIFTGTSTTVQICTAEDLTAALPTLIIYIVGTSDSVTVEGALELGTPPKCANFPEVPYKYTEDPLRYELILKDQSNPSVPLGRGVTTLAITVKTTLLTCDSSSITKITWSAEETIPDAFCVEESATLDKVCYHNEDLTEAEFCFTVNDGTNDVNVCLNGPTDDTPSATGAVTMNYFYYGAAAVDNVPADATLSLAMGTVDLAQLRAIVRLADDPALPGTPGKATIHDCSITDCTFTAYERKFAKYEVCVEAMDINSKTLETVTTSFKDLNLNVFNGGSQKSMLLESVFANGLLPDKKYTATLYQEAPPNIVEDSIKLDTATLDCTSVMDGHACFGFLDTGTGTGIVHQTLSDEDGFNTIIVPFNTQLSL